MPWLYTKAFVRVGVVTATIENAQDGDPPYSWDTFYYGQGDPLTDPAFIAAMQANIQEHIDGKEQERAQRVNATNVYRPHGAVKP